MTVCPLFSDSRDDAHFVYHLIRDRKNDGAKRARKRCEDLWIDFAKFADDNFLSEFPINFNQRWFEMYLTVFFIRTSGKNISVERPKSGPDILLRKNGRRIWIEAVCPKPGQPGSPDSVPEVKFGEFRLVPFDQYALRIRQSLDSKQEKYKKYLMDGLIGYSDSTVVAISTSDITWWQFNMEESMVRSLYGVGDKFQTIDPISRELEIPVRMHRREIFKSSGAKVGVVPFLDSSMDHITAVIGSKADTTTNLHEIGKDCVLYPNLTTRNPWRSGCLPFLREYGIEDTGTGWRFPEV